MKIKINELKKTKYKIIDNGVEYYPESIHLQLGEEISALALFSEDSLTDKIRLVCRKTHHDPPMYSAEFKFDSEDDIVEIVEYQKSDISDCVEDIDEYETEEYNKGWNDCVDHIENYLNISKFMKRG